MMFEISALWIRLLGTSVFLAALLFFICPFFVGIHHAGCYAGSVICILGILFFVANAQISSLLQSIWKTEFGHFALCLIMGLMILGIIGAISLSIAMIQAANDQPKEENIVVILGCKVRNGAPSLMLQRRLDAAVAYLQQHDVPVIVCGGQGADESISEAQCMQEYLIAHGIAENRIYQDAISASTLENLENAKEIIEQQEWLPEITIITDGYHQFRAALIAHNLKLKTSAISAKTSWYLVPSYWVREWIGNCYQLVFG